MSTFQLKTFQLPQRDLALSALRNGRVFIDTSTTGAGKTYIALAVATELALPALVIAPKASHTQWARVASTCPHVRLIGITNPESLIRSTSNPFYNLKTRLWTLPDQPLLVIFDEVHRGASGEKSLTTEALARLKAYPKVKLLAMSATLAETPLKMRATGYWLNLHRFNTASFHQFCLHNGCYLEAPPGSDKQRLVFTRSPSLAKQHMANIRNLTSGQMNGLTVHDIPGFPEQHLEINLIDLTKKDQNEINKAYEEMSDRMKSPSVHYLGTILRDRERIEFIKATYIADEALRLIEDGYSVPIFLNFTSSRERLVSRLLSRLTNSPATIPQIIGGQDPVLRQQYIDAFQSNEARLIVIMAQAGGLAISLHDVHHTNPRFSIVSPSYSASEFLQCLGRTRRVGGSHARQQVFIAANTREEKIAETLSRKLDNLDALNDDDLNPLASTHSPTTQGTTP